MPRWLVWAQNWEETERGWGCRPDGFTLHATKDSIALLLNRMREREAAAGYSGTLVPEAYTRPDGEPFEVILTDQALITAVEEDEEGVWGKGSSCKLPPVKGTAALHTYDKEEQEGRKAMETVAPWKAPISTELQEFLLQLGKNSPDVVMTDRQIRDCIRLGVLETHPPWDFAQQPVQLRLSHYGWVWAHWKTGHLLCEDK